MIGDADTPARSAEKGRAISGAHAASGATDTRWHKVFCAFFFLVPINSVLASQSVVPLLLVTAALLAVTIWRTMEKNRWPRPDWGLTAALGGLIVFCALASLWGFDPPRSLLLAARIAILLAAGLFLHAAQRHLDESARSRAGNWLLAGIVLALIILYLEVALEYPLMGLLHEPADWATTPEKWAANAESLLNRGATAVAILCWPACVFLWRRAGTAAMLCLPVAVLAALVLLSSQAAVFGLIGAAITAIVAGTHGRAGRIVLVLATLGAMVVSPLAGQKFYETNLQDAEWLPLSAAHRVEIWHFTVQRIVEKPVLGWGFDAARYMKRLAAEDEASGRSPIALHPHNAPLQVLLELGIVGALIILAIAWILIQRLENLPKRERILGQATYIAVLAVSCTSYGFWQNQWLALLVSTALAVSLTAPAAKRVPAEKAL